MKTIDSIQRPVNRPQTRSAPLSPPLAGTGARFTKIKGTSNRRRVPWRMVLVIALSPVLFGIALLGTVGVGVAVLGSLVALFFRVPSRYSLTVALMALLYMVGAQLGAARGLAHIMAALVYVFLALGAISLAVELKSARGVWFKKH